MKFKLPKNVRKCFDSQFSLAILLMLGISFGNIQTEVRAEAIKLSANTANLYSELPKGDSLFSEGRVRQGVQGFGTNNAQNSIVILQQEFIAGEEDIRLSDLFINLPKQFDQNLMASPMAGKEVKLSAEWLYELTKKIGIDWQPLGRGQTVIIKRPGNQVVQADLVRILKNYIQMQTNIPMGSISLVVSGDNTSFYLPNGTPISGDVTHWQLDPVSNRFQATLALPDKITALNQVSLSGRLVRITKIPVPIRRIERGRVLNYDDFTYADIEEADIDDNRILRIEDLVGQEARHQLTEGRPILKNSIKDERIIKRGDPLIITLTTESMQLAAVGKALQDGVMGETIKVRNEQSKIQIDAIVEGQGRVKVLLLKPNYAVN